MDRVVGGVGHFMRKQPDGEAFDRHVDVTVALQHQRERDVIDRRTALGMRGVAPPLRDHEQPQRTNPDATDVTRERKREHVQRGKHARGVTFGEAATVDDLGPDSAGAGSGWTLRLDLTADRRVHLEPREP